jgi:hypothetical protein
VLSKEYFGSSLHKHEKGAFHGTGGNILEARKKDKFAKLLEH